MSSSTTAPLRFAVVDVETSGLSSQEAQLLQVAVVGVEYHPDAPSERDVIVDHWSSYVRLRHPLASLGPRHIHGIHRRHVWRAPRVVEVIEEIRDRIDGAVFVAHNASFDRAFLVRASRACSARLELDPAVCTLKMSRRLDPDRRRSHRLADLCQHYGVDPGRAHHALHDALATATILPHLLRAHEVHTVEDLGRFAIAPAGASR